MRGRKAFTLVELLVVIGIIAVLIAILLPALRRAQEQGKRIFCMNNHKQLLMAARLYAEDWKGRLPFTNSNNHETAGNGWKKGGWLYLAPNKTKQEDVETGTLWKYLRNYKIYHCPFDEQPYLPLNSVHTLTSYCMNYHIAQENTPPWLSFKITQFKATDVLFWETDEKGDPGGYWNDGNNTYDQGITARHGSKNLKKSAGAIVGCVGGHAEWLTVRRFEEEAVRRGGRVLCSPIYRR
ncbi:MAG: type II secretion system protein [Planctomycetota bacterium]|nr:type II secretion system protein [Planctomycetota bacterium]